MGQTASEFLDCRFWRRDNSEQIKHQQLLSDLRLIQQENDERKVLSLKQRHKSLLNQTSQQSFVESKVSVDHEHILKFSLIAFPKSMEYEGGFIEIPEMSLSDILQAKLNTNLYFPPNDIHAMLGGILSAMSYLQTNNTNHHDIHPTSIYYSNSRYKLSNPITSQSGYERTFNQKRFSYLSPELIEALVNGVAIDDHTLFFKPDVFSFGMVMLECCSLKSSSQCYDPESYGIVEIHVRNRLNEIEARYSRSVSELIEGMLEPDPKKRLSAVQVFEVFQNPQSLRASLPRTDQVPPMSASLASFGNPHLTGKEQPPHAATDRVSRDYNVMVTPPPADNMSNSLSLSTVNPRNTRPPTFNPNSFGQPVVRRETINPSPIQRTQSIPRRQGDPRILPGGRNHR